MAFHNNQERNDLRSQCSVLRDQEEKLRMLLKSAKHLIVSATGPTDGPTNWNETRDNWLAEAKKQGII